MNVSSDSRRNLIRYENTDSFSLGSTGSQAVFKRSPDSLKSVSFRPQGLMISMFVSSLRGFVAPSANSALGRIFPELYSIRHNIDDIRRGGGT